MTTSRSRRGVMSQEAFRTWRSSIPFTDEQIARALEQAAYEVEGTDNRAQWVKRNCLYYADLVRRLGRVTSKTLSAALPFLVTTCGLCGKRALYRVGPEGRCSTHRLVPLQLTKRAVRRDREAKASAFEEERKARDARDRYTGTTRDPKHSIQYKDR